MPTRAIPARTTGSKVQLVSGDGPGSTRLSVGPGRRSPRRRPPSVSASGAADAHRVQARPHEPRKLLLAPSVEEVGMAGVLPAGGELESSASEHQILHDERVR